MKGMQYKDGSDMEPRLKGDAMPRNKKLCLDVG